MANSDDTRDSGPPDGRVPSSASPSPDPNPATNSGTARVLAIAIPAVLAVVAVILVRVLILGDRRPVNVEPRDGGRQVAGEPQPGAAGPAGGATPVTLDTPDATQPPATGSGQPTQPGQPEQPAATTTQAAPTTAVAGGSGAWPRFRNSDFSGASDQTVGLARSWPPSGPRQVWSMKMLGPGHAGAAILGGRVYTLDYDQGKREDVLRCLSLADGGEIWRTSYPVEIKDNHGISRTVPAVTDRYVVSLGPLGHVTCARTDSGEVLWQADLVKTYGTKIPSWYAGQCPLIDGDKAILAPGGSALMIAVDCASGRVVWRTPNPRNWQMTHASIIPMSIGGTRTYVYPATGGVVGVSPGDGSLLWQYPGWTVNTANAPSPLSVGGNRIFLTGGYGAGAMLLSVSGGNPSQVWKIPQNVFGSHQHTPVFHQNHIFGVAMDRQFVCLDLNGKRVWSSGHTATFGIGPYLLAEGMFYILNGDDGTLVLAEATTSGYSELARAKVLPGHDAWAPMALADGMLVCRDRETMICLDVKTP